MARNTSNPDNRLLIDLKALEHNLAVLRGLLPAGCRVAGVVKADAYGHGLLPTARRLKSAGAEALAVAVAAEGAALRRAGVAGPIWLLLGVRPPQARQAALLDLTPISADLEAFRALHAAGQALGRPVSCQLKVDTGMSRLGVPHGQALEFLEQLKALDGIRLIGLASHLATAGDPASSQAVEQAGRFAGLLAAARQDGWQLADSSLSGSGGVMVPPPLRPGPPAFARLGIGLYGCLPDPACAGLADLRPVMSFSTRLLAVRPAPAGSLVSYGATWRAQRDTWLGVLPVGYSDGYPRALSNRAKVLVGGQRAPVRGRVCMNLTMVDLGDLPALPAVGQEVVLLGRQAGGEISAGQLGDWAGTISYEITCGLGAANRRRTMA
ncbi:MAG: alanine racemase [Desulfarculus sp.]|nr:alanine racemase [Desulfarculus sp.]